MAKTQPNEPEPIATCSLFELRNIVKAKIPFSYVITHDEQQCIREIYNGICLDDDKETVVKKLFVWSGYSGIIEYKDGFFGNTTRATGYWEGTWSPVLAIEKIVSYADSDDKKSASIFIFRDFQSVFTPAVARQIKDIYSFLLSHENTRYIIAMGGSLGHVSGGAIKQGIEPSLEKFTSIVRWKLPTREQIEQYIRVQCTCLKKNLYTNEDFYKFSRAVQGLTMIEVENAVAACFAELSGKLDANRLMKEKKQIIMRSDVLEYIESDQTLDDLGGLDNLKNYIKNNYNSHSEEAEEFGVEPLKGIILIGVPGSGKSASAKAVGNLWGVPTLRLDVGKVMHGLVGGSEQKMREVIAQAESVAPCVVWLDEIEKALSGTKSSNFSDGGTLSRVFGTLLTAMEEGFKGVVVIATANDISMLPPELIRRFSETFYVSLPTIEERKDIWNIWLKKKKRNPVEFDIGKLAQESDQFTGAEIVKSLREAIAMCFNDNKRKVTTEDIVTAIKSTKPIAVVMASKIQETEKWAKERCRYASSLKETVVKAGGIKTSKGKTLTQVSDLDKPEEAKSSRLESIQKSIDDGDTKN